MPPDGRASADGGVVMLHFARARGRNQFGQGFTPDAREREVDDVGVAEEIVKKRFDRFQRVGSTELKENYPHTPCCARHFPRNPRTRQCTPNRARESMADLKKLFGLRRRIQRARRQTANPWQLHRQRDEICADGSGCSTKIKKREPERCGLAHSQTHALNR